LGLASAGLWATVQIGKAFDGEGFSISHLAAACFALPVVAGAWFVLVGAFHMVKFQSYLWAVTAAIVALLPWSPGWVLGLPFGIWALMVLSKPEVMAAFLGDRRDLIPSFPEPQESPDRGPGRFRAFFRSVGRYCLTKFSGRQQASQQIRPDMMPGNEPRPPEMPNPHQPVTVDYTPEPANPNIKNPQK
jgi:hypothetical protein